MPNLPGNLPATLGILCVLFAIGGALNAIVHKRRRGSDQARASLWPRFWVWLAIALVLLGFAAPGPAAWATLLLVIAVQAAREAAAACRAAGWPADAAGAMLASAAAVILPLFDPEARVIFAGSAVVFAAGLAASRDGIRAVVPTIIVALYVGAPLACLVLLRAAGTEAGFDLVAWTMLVVILTDIAAMFGGLFFGRHKLAPSISPGKTVEGALIGIAGALLAAALVRFMFPLAGWAVYLGAAAVVGVADLLGDLAASWIKRRAGLKDFSAALPGHGGVMDRIDGLLFAAPLAWLLAPLVLG
jgi:phosphatidate cytidylyltransferase